MQITNNRNNVGFSAVTVDGKNIAKLGPEFVKGLRAAMPEIEKRSKGVDVLLTADNFNGIKWFKIIAQTKKYVGGLLGFLVNKKGKSTQSYYPYEALHNYYGLEKVVRDNMTSARRNLRRLFDSKYGSLVFERDAAREARKALNILNKQA